MPELPEVETIRRELLQKIRSKKIASVEVLTPKMINCPVNEFIKIIKNAKIKDIQRRAKLLIIKLSNGYNLVVHLKLTGQFIYEIQDIKYTHLIFTFEKGDKLFFNDLRKFAFVKLLDNKELKELLTKENFGPEPLEKNFTLDIFQNLLTQKKKAKIKPLLMNQEFLAGVGNIYASESCFYAKILPTRPAGNLTKKEIKELYQGLRKILSAAIIRKGSSVNQYIDIYGKKGEYVPFLKVYNRQGKLCLRCGTKIKKITLAGRGTYFCPGCQK